MLTVLCFWHCKGTNLGLDIHPPPGLRPGPLCFLIDGFLRNPVYLGETDIGNMFTCHRNQMGR
jgi:hypothetical protein